MNIIKNFWLRLFLVPGFILLVGLSCNLPIQPGFNLPGMSQPTTPDILARTSQSNYAYQIAALSGAQPVTIGGETVVIATRYSYAMFTDQPNARAFEYILEQVRGWYPENQIEIDDYPYTDAERTYTWKNLIVTIPGTTRPGEVVAFSAHLDSTVVREGNALEAAPGANDNGTGAAALLEAARIFSHVRFERTVQLIWFSGEENGLAGSRAYVLDHTTDNIAALVNMDMFGTDTNGDRCFEIHAGSSPAAAAVGQAVTQAIQVYGLNLSYDFLTNLATDRSDHAAFWEKGVPAVTIIENFFDNGLPDGCAGVDGTPYYHRPSDTLDKVNLPYAVDIARAGIAAVSDLAVPARQIKSW